jgi:Zn-dependent peptidase ImmA (M78 family)
MERDRLGLGSAPIRDVMDLLDGSAGVRCFSLADDRQRWVSFSTHAADGRPCIALNACLAAGLENERWAVEYARVLVGIGADDAAPGHLATPDLDRADRPADRFARAFAMAFLMPRSSMHVQARQRLGAREVPESLSGLIHLALHYGVSPRSMQARLVDLRLLPRAPRADDRSSEPDSGPATAENSDGSESSPARVGLPARFRYLAIRAYLEEIISLAKLAELLREDYYVLREQLNGTTTDLATLLAV